MPRSSTLFVVAAALACTRAPPEPVGRDTARAEAPASSKAATANEVAPALSAPAEAAERPFRFPAAERVVAVGDLHGDLASTREALRLARAVDDKDRWIGGKLVLVQTGDQLDRGDDEPEILALLERLAEEAARSGGALHALNGNHEIMNAAGDFRYVTEDGFRDYATAPVASAAKLARDVPEAERGRATAFRPGSDLARRLAHRNTIAIVGDTLFAHAGILPKHVRYGLGRINDEVRRFLRGEIPALPEIVDGEDAPVWTRVYGSPAPSGQACRDLDAVLASLSVKRLVVGHTVQKTGVTSACNGSVYRIDVGLSDYYGKNPTQVLEIGRNGVKVLGSVQSVP